MKAKDFWDLFFFRLKNNVFRFLAILVTSAIMLFLCYGLINLQYLSYAEYKRYTEETYKMEGSLWRFNNKNSFDTGYQEPIIQAQYNSIKEGIRKSSSDFNLFSSYSKLKGDFSVVDATQILFSIHLSDFKKPLNLERGEVPSSDSANSSKVYIKEDLYRNLIGIGKNIGDLVNIGNEDDEFWIEIAGVHQYDEYDVIMGVDFAFDNDLTINSLTYIETGYETTFQNIKHNQNIVLESIRDDINVSSTMLHKINSYKDYYTICLLVIIFLTNVLIFILVALSYNNLKLLLDEEKHFY